MAGISSQVVSVNVVVATRAAAAANFGTPAIFCVAPFVGGKLYELGPEGLAAMVTDGFTVNDRGYKLASTMASQEPHASQVLVYSRQNPATCVVKLTPLITTDGYRYNFNLTYKGITSSILTAALSSDTVETVCDDLKTLIDASAAGLAGLTVTDNITDIDITAGEAGEPVIISGLAPAAATVLDTTPDGGIATDLAAMAADTEKPAEPYRFVIDTFSEAENNAAAAWAEANANLFFAQSGDSTNIVDAAGTGVGQDFATAAYNRASLWHSSQMADIGAAIAARQAAINPGESQYGFKTLSGVNVDTLTATHIANAKGKNVNLYALDGSTPHTWFGLAASGRSLRIQTALDLLDARIKEAILGAFLSNEVVPMSDDGFAIQKSAVSGVLARFQAAGVILPGWSVTVPTAASLSNADLVAGNLNSLRFSAVMPNDMNSIQVNGVLSFS